MVTMKLIAAGMTILYLVLLCILLYCAKNKQERYLTAKMTCSSLFLVLGILYGMCASSLRNFLWMFPALLFCFMGDYFIGIFRKSKNTRHFMLGLSLFLMAHIGFAVFVMQWYPGVRLWNLLLPAALGMVFLVLERVCGLHMKRLKWPAFFYCLVLSFFLIKALGFAYTVGNDGSIFIGVGAVLFFLSDLSICFLYFISYKSAGKKLAMHYFNLVTYYISILVLEMGMGYL